MPFQSRSAFYLRISASNVIPLYLYLDEQHIEWMSDRILQHVLADLRPKIVPKMKAEADVDYGPAYSHAKKGNVDVHRGGKSHSPFFYAFAHLLPSQITINSRISFEKLNHTLCLSNEKQNIEQKSLEQSRNFVLDNNPPPPPPVPKPSDSKSQTSKRKHRRSANKEINETSKKRKMQGKQRSREGNEHAMETSVEDVIEADDHAEAAVTPSVTSRRSARAKKPIVGGYREQDEDAIMDEEWENPPNVLGQGRRTQAIVTQTSNAIGSSAQGGDGGSSTDAVVIKDEVDEPALASPVYGPPEASDVTMEGTAASSAIPRDPDMVIEIEDDEEPKPKLSLRLQYQGFSIYGRCLCVIVEPWPSLKSASRAPSLAPPGISSLRPKSIAPPEFVPSRAETPGQRARTPLFLPDFDREMSAAPGPSRLRTSLHPALEREDGNGFGSNIDDDNAGLMAFSQVLSATAETGRAVEDDDDFEGAVFFADADEAREL